MMLIFKYAEGATPIDPDEMAGLIPIHITTQGQLNEWEAENILKAENWLISSLTQENILTIPFIRLLHKKMFGDTWRWAGTFRNSNKNIGVDYSMITTKLKHLFDDVVYQLAHHIYLIDEIAYRFHHRMVGIHPFPNGNGRHARMIADIFLLNHHQPRFTWGSHRIDTERKIRKQYIQALKSADQHDYEFLKRFVRT